MEDLESGLDAKERRYTVAGALGIIALVAGGFLTGPLAALAFAIGGALTAMAAHTALCPDKADACPPSCWPERDAPGLTAEPEAAVAVDAPASVRKWLDRVAPAAAAPGAKRSRSP